MQTILILLVESGLVYFLFQVSGFCILLVRKILKVFTVLIDNVHDFSYG